MGVLYCNLALMLLVSLSSPAVQGQTAPVSGAHYAARASSTGFTGSVGAGGGYGAAVPLDFSPADASVPIPVAVVYNGGKHMGAAGLGWDVPLSYVYHDTSTARRRPESATQGHERWTLNLLGDTVNLVLKSTTPRNVWVAERGHPQLEVQALNDPNSLVVYDGEGRSFFFDRRDLTNGDDGTLLANGNLFLLTEITAPGNRAIAMDYAFSHPTLPGGGTGLSIDLNEVFYNYGGSGFNYKNRAILRYNVSPTPLAITLLGTTPLARMNTLATISVLGNRTPTSDNEFLRTYTFDYADATTHQPKPDPDTGLPRLRGVTMTGRQGTPEFATTLPVASYDYASVVDATRKVTYEKSQTLSPPFVFSDGDTLLTNTVAYTAAATNATTGGSDLVTIQNAFDLTGDGRPDFFGPAGFFGNKPDGSGGITFPERLVQTGAATDVTNRIHSAPLLGNHADTVVNVNSTLRELIDMNGDGRLDLVEVTGLNDWTIHLNTPDPSDPDAIKWVSVDVPVNALRTALPAGSLNGDIRAGAPSHFDLGVPLKRATTVKIDARHCWKWTQGGTEWTEVADFNCGSDPNPPNPAPFVTRTITEFALVDVNGDGYPDFVFNNSNVALNGDLTLGRLSSTAPTQFQRTRVLGDLTGDRSIKVMLNVAGARLKNGATLFAPPVTLEPDSPAGCGVERWDPDATDFLNANMSEVCGLVDVNGDGIPDRVTSTSHVALGTGDQSQPFSAAVSMTLPGPLAHTFATSLACTLGHQPTTLSRSTGLLLDINGDGIPDYVESTDVAAPVWNVRMGTGIAYAPPVDIVSPAGFEFALTTEACPGVPGGHPEVASTTTGMFDLDGDGQPEVVSLTQPVQNPTHWDVYQLKRSVPQPLISPRFSVPEAGRLTRIDNGYGASTVIAYQSAKEDFESHSVAYPEIVATAVGTRDSSNLNTPLAATIFYAYGNPLQYFDASADAFVSAGYGRTVQVTRTVDDSAFASTATITDRFEPQPFTGTTNTDFGNNLIVGMTRDVTVLSDSNLGVNAWSLLGTDIASDTRRVAGEHKFWGTRSLPAATKPANNTVCVDADPYNFVAPPPPAPADDMCLKNGFAFETSDVSWRGQPGSDPQPALSRSVVATDVEVKAADVDDFGRLRVVGNFNDLNRGDDDQCITTAYANPPSAAARPRVLNLPAQRTVTDCGATPRTLSNYTWEYDTDAAGTKLPAGQVTNGFVTSHIVTRLDENGNRINGVNGLSDIRLYDARVDSHGNVLSTTTTRDDGATRTLAVTSFDAFGLVPLGTTLTATNADGSSVPGQTSSVVRDPLTLALTNATDENGSQTGATFDGFGRVLTSTTSPTTGAAGVLSSVSYQGFAKNESGGRRITQKVFTDPVANPATAAGRTGITYLDSLGRTLRTEVNLGADYGGQVMVVGQRTYDLEGRVKFLADPTLSTQNFATAYGTTYYYNVDRTPSCFVRSAHDATTAPSSPSATIATDESREIYATCFRRTYEFNNFTEVQYTQGPDSLLTGSPQFRVKELTAISALGLPLVQSTVQTDGGGAITSVLARTHLGYDHLGRQTLMQRFQDPNGIAGSANTTSHYDSMGQLVELDEPAPNAPQFRSYDSWGELTATGWCDPAFGACSTTADSANRKSIASYDALGRLLHREDRTKNDGVAGHDQNALNAIAGTVNDYVYDQGVDNATPRVTATNVLGRLAKATSPTSSVSFSYDPYGRVNAEVFTDRTVGSGNVYVEKHEYHGDGLMSALHLLLPDSTNFVDEHVDYSYDSAGRETSVAYSDGATTQSLFSAIGGSGIDVLGRVRHAQYGLTAFEATYAETGRRLISDVKVSSPAPLSTSREVSFVPVSVVTGSPPPVTAFDPLGRERQRQEFVNGASGPVRTSGYDALGRLTGSGTFTTGSVSLQESFAYDPLGNITLRNDVGGTQLKSAHLSYRQDDRDRICGIGYFLSTAPTSCNVTYDAVGNIVSEPTRLSPISNLTRTFAYFPSGQVRQVSDPTGRILTFDYDAFGAVQQLVMNPGTSTARHDKHFGSLIKVRDEAGAPSVNRMFPVPGGVATRHGATSAWTFALTEPRGTRFVTDQSGQFVQDLDYTPFGESQSCAAPKVCVPGAVSSTDEQWNEGDFLAPFKLVRLGARLYDPLIGRFTSRDPIFDQGNRFNPYAFAANDPINDSDPSGAICMGAECSPGGGGGCAPGVNCGGEGNGQPLGPVLRKIGSAIEDAADWVAHQFSCLLGCSEPEPLTSSYTSGSHHSGVGVPPSFNLRGEGSNFARDSDSSALGTLARDGLFGQVFDGAGNGSRDPLRLPPGDGDGDDDDDYGDDSHGVAAGANLPMNPDGLGPDWVEDTQHRHPNGKQFVNTKTGQKVQWHPARPGKGGHQESDHWHLKPNDKKHIRPGEDHPDFHEREILTGIGLGYLIYRGVRLLPSLVPIAWPTLPANLAIP